MLPSSNPSSAVSHSIEISAPSLFLLGQNFHDSNSINPLLTFFNFASLVFANLFYPAAFVSIEMIGPLRARDGSDI